MRGQYLRIKRESLDRDTPEPIAEPIKVNRVYHNKYASCGERVVFFDPDAFISNKRTISGQKVLKPKVLVKREMDRDSLDREYTSSEEEYG